MTRPDGSATVMTGDRRLEYLVLCAASFLILAPGAFWGLPSGKSVAGALVILDGGVPYRDFWSMYAPGQFYAVAALYRLFGAELLVQAIAVGAVRAAAAVAYFVLLERLGAPRQVAWALSALFVLMFWTTAPGLTDYPLALPFLLLALDRIVRYDYGQGVAHLRWAGGWLGVAAWFKHDVAAYVAVGAAVSLVASWVLLRGVRPQGWVSPGRAVRPIVVFALAAVAPVACWTAWSAGSQAWNDLIVFPLTVFSKVRGDRFPPVIPDAAAVVVWLADVTHVRNALRAADSLSGWIVLYAPVVTFAAGAGALLWRGWRLETGRLASLTLLLACMPFFWAAAHVQQNTHPYSLAILAGGAWVLLVPAFAGGRGRPTRGLRWLLRLGAPVYAAGLLSTAAVDAAAVYYQWQGSRLLDLPGFRGVRVPARVYESFHPIGVFFRTHTAPDEPIYTGLVRHDAIVINNALLYAIAGRSACCGYTELHPGVADRAAVQQEIVRRLEGSRVRAIALWRFGWSDQVMAARKQRTMAGVPDAGSTILDRYIQDHFDTLETHGEYHVLWRRDVPVPVYRANVTARQQGAR